MIIKLNNMLLWAQMSVGCRKRPLKKHMWTWYYWRIMYLNLLIKFFRILGSHPFKTDENGILTYVSTFWYILQVCLVSCLIEGFYIASVLLIGFEEFMALFPVSSTVDFIVFISIFASFISSSLCIMIFYLRQKYNLSNLINYLHTKNMTKERLLRGKLFFLQTINSLQLCQ